MPLAGETIHSESFEIGFGGKGCNQAIAAARMGCSTAVVGKIGNDPYGKSYKEHFEKEGVNTDYFDSAGAYTGIALIVVDAFEGNNQIVINPNANQNLSKQDVSRANDILKSSKVFYHRRSLTFYFLIKKV
jgi:ribokinase